MLETASDYSHQPAREDQPRGGGGVHQLRGARQSQPKAIELFQKTLSATTPSTPEVGQVLAEIYFEENQDYHAADPIYDMLGRKVDQLELDPDEQRDMFLRAAHGGSRAAQPRQGAQAVQARLRHRLDQPRGAGRGWPTCCSRSRTGIASFKLYQTILVQHRDTQSDEDTVRVYYRLGTIKNMQQEPRKALNYFEKALEVESAPPRDAAGSVINLQAQNNDWEGVIEAKKALVDITPEVDAQFALYKDIGELYQEKLGNQGQGGDAVPTRR